MNFVESLRQKRTLEAQRVEQEKADQEAKEKARLHAEVTERERRAPRRQQAEEFREQSGVGAVVAELGAFLGTPTTPITVRVSITDRGYAYEDEKNLAAKDPDSVFDCVSWDNIKRGSSSSAKKGWYGHFSQRYIAVETCPNGTIVFHGGVWRGSTTIPLTKWRGNNRELIFDKALEKAFKNPAIHRFSVYYSEREGA